MAGARKEEGNAAMVNILKKMDAMLENTNEVYQEQLMILNSIETVQKTAVVKELQTQTKILQSIESKLAAAGGGAGDKGNVKAFKEAFGDVAIVIEKLLKAADKIDDKKTEQIANFFNKLADSINNFVDKVDKEKAKAATDLIETITGGVFKYAFYMILATPLLILSLPGAFLFGLSLRLLLSQIKNVDPNAVEGIAMAVIIGKYALLYALSMVVVAIASPFMIIGALGLGVSIRLLLFTAGEAKKGQVEFLTSVLGLARGAILYSLAMIVVSILSPIAIVGSLLLGLSIRLLMFAAGTAKEGQTEAITAVLGLARAAILYSLAMIVVTLLSPIVIIGSLALGLSIRLLLLAAGSAKEGQVAMMQAVLGLAKGALLYTLAMVLVTLAAPFLIIGSLIFGLSIRLLLFAAGTAKKEGVAAMNAILTLSKGILLYVLAMIIVTLLMPIVLIGTLIFVGTMWLLKFGLNMIGSKKAQAGVRALIMTAIGIFLFGLVIWAFSKMVDFMDILKVAVAIAGIGIVMWGMGKFSKEITKGAVVLLEIGVALIVFSIGFAIFAAAVKTVTWEHLAMMGAVITFLALIGTVLGIPPINAFAAAGAGILLLLGAAFAVFAVGFLIFATSIKILDKGDDELMGGVIKSIGMAMIPIGLFSPLVLLGSAAMVVAGAALVPLAIGMGIFKASGFTKEDGENLASGLGSIVDGFLGGKMPGGILAGIKFAAGAAARAALLLIAVGPMALAGLALLPITASLLVFKKAKFGKDDADSLEYMIGSIVRAFGIVTDTERQKKMGFYVNPWDLMLGIMSLSGAGRVLAGLAEGVQAWANLEVNEWEVVDGGTAKAKLVIKGRRKLGKSDFENAAYGMAQVITAISKPFADVGKLEKGESSGNPLLDMVFGGNFVSTGINALKRAGDTIVNLATGVQSFANLEITEYEVVNAGTKDAKLVPKSRTKMDPTQIAMASANIAMVIGVVAEAFAKVGKMESESSGWFSGGFVSKGVSALHGVGDILKSVTEGVIAMAHNEIPQFELIAGGTKDAKLVPAKPLVIDSTMLAAAAVNIGEVLGIVAGAIADIGRMEDESSGWFSDGYVTKGTAALAGVGDTVSKIADAVIKFATGEIPQFDLINGGTKDAKLVPAKSLKITPTMIMDAGYLIGDIIGIVGREVNRFGEWVENNGDSIGSATEAITSMTDVVANAAKPLEVWAKVKDPYPTIFTMLMYFNALKDVYDPKNNQTIGLSSWYFTQFATNAGLLADSADAFTKVADNYDRIQKSMKLMQTHINGMDLKKLTLTDSMMRSIAAMSKNPEAIAKMVGDTMSKSFEELITALKELAVANTPAPPAGGGGFDILDPFNFKGDDPKKPVPKDKPVNTPAPKMSDVSISNVSELANALAFAMKKG